VLTSCDYRDSFPPPMFRYFKAAAAIPRATRLLMLPIRLRTPPAPVRFRLAGQATDRAPGRGLLPARKHDHRRRRARPQTRHQGFHPRYTNEAADRLGTFDKPALIAWSRKDRFFKPAHAERLAHDPPNARLEYPSAD
jgi:pimeloyl-ACP methyl ester carboxylesterase